MRRAQALALSAATAAFAAITVTYALSVPVGSSADELSHLNYAQIISNHLALPGPAVPERQQPPLYYLLSAALLRLGAAPVALRFLSIVLGAIAIVCVARTVRHLAPAQPWLAVATAAALALLPGFQFVSASVTDDSLATAAGALLLLVTTRVALTPAPTHRLLLWVGFSTAVALLSKETDLPLIVVLAGVVVWRWRRKLALRDAVPLGSPIAVIAGWWFVRNLVAFHRPLPPLTPLGVPPHKLRTAGELRSFFSQSLRGLFTPERYQGSPLTLPPGGRVLLAALAVVALLLLAAGILLAARSWTRWEPSRRVAVTAYALAAVGAGVVSLANAVVVVFQPQGRYLLVAATGPLLAMVRAVRWLGRDRVRVITLSAILAAAALSLSIVGLTTAMAGSA